MLCPANMLGEMPATRVVILSEVRACFRVSRASCGRANAVEGPLFDCFLGNPRLVPRYNLRQSQAPICARISNNSPRCVKSPNHVDRLVGIRVYHIHVIRAPAS